MKARVSTADFLNSFRIYIMTVQGSHRDRHVVHMQQESCDSKRPSKVSERR